MITKENLKSVMDSITKEDIEKVFNSNDDYLSLQLYIFNAGYFVELNSIEPYTNKSEEIEANGGLIIDKDDFLRLFKESESINPFLIELI